MNKPKYFIDLRKKWGKNIKFKTKKEFKEHLIKIGFPALAKILK